MTKIVKNSADLADPEWDSAMYPVAEAARLVGLSATRVHRWLKGYQYRYAPAGGKTSMRQLTPVVRREGTAGSTYASFLDLIDLVFVKQFLRHGISPQKIRKALTEAFDLLGATHFARETFFTDGKQVYLKVKDDGGAILELLSGGQWVIPQIIEQLAHRIEFDKPTGFARRWYPMGQEGLIVLDPQVAFGRPSIIGKGIDTLNVYDFYLAEEKKGRRVSSWMNLSNAEVEAAVKFEELIAA